MNHRLLFLLLVGHLLASLAPVAGLGRAEGSIQKTWNYSDVTSVIVDADRQDVVVREAGPRFSGRLLGDTGDDVQVVREGPTVTLTVRSGHGWFSWKRKASRLELSVPPGMVLDLTTASGAVLVQARTSALRVRTASGDIEASRGGERVDADSTSGTVRLKAFAGPVKAASLSGDLLLEDLAGDVQAATLSGDLTGRGLTPADRSRFTTVSGDADLELAGGAEAYAVATESVSGSLEVGDARAEGSLRAGSGPVVVVKSVSGDIQVR